MKYLVLFVVGAASLRPRRCKQTSRIFFQRLSGVSSKFLQKAFMSRTLHFIGDFYFDILLTVLDVFHFVCFIYVRGLLIKRVFVY